jgi:hypothetical protein
MPVLLATQRSGDLEDQGFEASPSKELRDPISKNPSQKRAGGVA